MDISHIAKLANLPLTENELKQHEPNLKSVLGLIDHIQKLNTSSFPTTAQVLSNKNISRPDVIDLSRILTPQQALSNAKKTLNNYFVVPAVLSEN